MLNTFLLCFAKKRKNNYRRIVNGELDPDGDRLLEVVVADQQLVVAANVELFKNK
jgi:hypothetical protein